MIPQFNILPEEDRLPLDHEVFEPATQEWLEEAKDGLCINQDWSCIYLVPEKDVREAISLERTALNQASQAKDPEEFEELLSEFEDSDQNQEAENNFLEIGVRSLVLALAAVGSVPVTACRSHASKNSYSQFPSVCVKIDVERIKLIDRLTRENNTYDKIEFDGETSVNGAIILGASIEDFINLAELLINNKENFKAIPLPIPPPTRQEIIDNYSILNFPKAIINDELARFEYELMA